jgi:hypothetical protein
MNTNFKELYVTYKQNGIENFPIGWWQSQAWLAKLIWFLESLIQSYSAKSTTDKSFHIQPYEFISKNNLSFFQGNVIKYVCRYLQKNGIQDIEKIIHYCELEIKKMKDMENKKNKK